MDFASYRFATIEPTNNYYVHYEAFTGGSYTSSPLDQLPDDVMYAAALPSDSNSLFSFWFGRNDPDFSLDTE